jgi:hypothetical protein
MMSPVSDPVETLSARPLQVNGNVRIVYKVLSGTVRRILEEIATLAILNTPE